MTAILRDGPLDWRLSSDDNGYRTYKLRLLIEVTDSEDGPATAAQCAGVPLPGDMWAIDNDLDVWVWARPDYTITPLVNEEPNYWFVGEYTFSNKPLTRDQAERRRGCHDIQIEDPLLEPHRVSGTFSKKTKEATHDRFGNAILNPAHEVVRGPAVEFDESRPTIKVVQNVPLLQFDLLCFLIDGLNDSALWGFPARWVRFANCTWEQQYHGQCYGYYTRTLEFEVREDWDRDILAEGEKVLKGHWGDEGEEGAGWVLDEIGGEAPDPDDPSHFIRAVDRHGNPTRLILTDGGEPATQLAIAVTGIAVDSPALGEMTVTVESAHSLETGDTVVILGARPPYYSGEYEVTSAPSTTAFVVEMPLDDMDAYESDGYIYVEGDGPGNVHVEKYPSVNLLQLDIPLTF